MPQGNTRQIKIMVSSTCADLGEYRSKASEIIRKIADENSENLHIVADSMENKVQDGERKPPVQISKEWIEKADWVIVVVGWNYGYISPEAEAKQLSVTEWEYRHAVSLLQYGQRGASLERKIFVFATGDPYTDSRYRWKEGEGEDLKDWLVDPKKQTKEQVEKIRKFRDQLGKEYLAHFSDLANFEQKLAKTLRKNILKLSPDVEAGTKLARVVLSVRDEIEECLGYVQLIATCKSIHDLLHKLLQYVLRPLQESYLPQWKNDVHLSRECERAIQELLNNAKELRGEIKTESKSLRKQEGRFPGAPDDRFCRLLGKLLDHKLSLPVNIGQEGLIEFSDIVNSFSRVSHSTFSSADNKMTRAENLLRDKYTKLKRKLEAARDDCSLNEAELKKLEEELSTVDSNRMRVKKALTIHHEWQGYHNMIRALVDALDYTSDLFIKQLEIGLEDWIPELAGLTWCEAPRSQPCNCELKFNAKIRHIEESVALLTSMSDPDEMVDGFEDMRKPFDDAFYLLDERTMAIMVDAEDRAREIKKWLNYLIESKN